jgi:hypothetical protein
MKMGKGSKPRPMAVDKKSFDESFEAIFGQKGLGSAPPSDAKNYCDSHDLPLLAGVCPYCLESELEL